MFLREYLQEVDAPDESLFVVDLDVGHDELGEVDVGLVECREERGVVHRGCIVGGHRGSERALGRFSEQMLRKKLARKCAARSFVPVERSAHWECIQQRRICHLDPEITTRTKYEIDEIDDTKKFDPLER